MNSYDFIVIGSGPAGRRAAIQAAKLGRSVLVVDKGRRVGGVSVHTGTIPSKTLRETVLNLTGWRERGFYGRAYRVKKDIEAKDLMARLHMTLDHEVDVLEHQFARNAVTTIARHGALHRSAPRRDHAGQRRHPGDLPASASCWPLAHGRIARPRCHSTATASSTATRSSRFPGCRAA